MKATARLTPADQARQLGLTVGDTILGREEWPNDCWHEVRLTLLWIGRQRTVWLEQRRWFRDTSWTPIEEVNNWTLECRDWQPVETPAEVRALLPGADAAISDEALAAEYRSWWMASYGVPPNHQAVAIAVAWGRHLLSLPRRTGGEVSP